MVGFIHSFWISFAFVGVDHSLCSLDVIVVQLSVLGLLLFVFLPALHAAFEEGHDGSLFACQLVVVLGSKEERVAHVGLAVHLVEIRVNVRSFVAPVQARLAAHLVKIIANLDGVVQIGFSAILIRDLEGGYGVVGVDTLQSG